MKKKSPKRTGVRRSAARPAGAPPPPPATYSAFIGRYPLLGTAWELTHKAGARGPLDEKTARLVKLALAIGAMREGAVHSSVRKARAAGIEPDAIDQVVALAASTLGFPATVAAFSWVEDELAR